MIPDRFALSATAVEHLAIAMRSFGCTLPEAEASMRRLGRLLSRPADGDNEGWEKRRRKQDRLIWRARMKRTPKYLAKGGVRR